MESEHIGRNTLAGLSSSALLACEPHSPLHNIDGAKQKFESPTLTRRGRPWGSCENTDSDPLGSGGGRSFCILDKLSGFADASSPQTRL